MENVDDISGNFPRLLDSVKISIVSVSRQITDLTEKFKAASIFDTLWVAHGW